MVWNMTFIAMYSMQHMSSSGKSSEMIGDKALNELLDEDLELNVEGLNV